jgi:hypothetical protein
LGEPGGALELDRPPVEPVDRQPPLQLGELAPTCGDPVEGVVAIDIIGGVEELQEQVGGAGGDDRQAVALTQVQERPRAAAVLGWAGPPTALQTG